MPDRKPPFFQTVARTFRGLGVYREVAPHGAGGAFLYLLKLGALTALLVVLALTLYNGYLIRSAVRPAFAGSPALSWKDGTLTAEGTVPFKGVVEEMNLAIAVDTRETPDRALLKGPEVTHLLTLKDLLVADAGEIKLDTPYGTSYDGVSFPLGQAYRFRIPEPSLTHPAVIMAWFYVALVTFVVAALAAVVASVVGVAILPQARRLGMGGVWGVSAHAMTPAVAAFLVLLVVFLFNRRILPDEWLPWVLFGVPLAVGMGVAYLAIRALGGEMPVPPTRPARPTSGRLKDDDLLPPDKV